MNALQYRIIFGRILIIAVILLISGFFYPLSSEMGFGVSSALAAPEALNGTKLVCPSGGDYATLTAAIADITSQGLDGPLVLELCASYTSDSETFPLTFTAFTGSNAANTVTVRPATGATGLSITGDNSTTIIDLNGATYVVIDGRPGGTGASQELTIINSNTAGITVRYINDAANNTVRNSILEGTNSSATSGVVVFGDTASGPNGNDSNTVTSNIIQAYGSNYPAILIYSSGSSSYPNSNNTITDNILRNYGINSTTFAYGIYIVNTSNESWTITGNTISNDASRLVNNMNGIRFGSLGTNTIDRNTIYNVYGYNNNYGIYLLDARDTTVSRNYIRFTFDSGTNAWFGVYNYGGNGVTASATLINNQIIISPTTSTNDKNLYGIFDIGQPMQALQRILLPLYAGQSKQTQ
jgi:parallel beta-helix repeat protein